MTIKVIMAVFSNCVKKILEAVEDAFCERDSCRSKTAKDFNVDFKKVLTKTTMIAGIFCSNWAVSMTLTIFPQTSF